MLVDLLSIVFIPLWEQMEPANRPVMAWIVYGDCIGQWLSSITKYTRQLTYKDRKCSQLEGSSLISLGLTVLGECKLTHHDSSGTQWGKNLQQKSGSKRGKERARGRQREMMVWDQAIPFKGKTWWPLGIVLSPTSKRFHLLTGPSISQMIQTIAWLWDLELTFPASE